MRIRPWCGALAVAAGAAALWGAGRTSGAAAAAPAEIPWQASFEAGAALARQNGKPLFVVFR